MRALEGGLVLGPQPMGKPPPTPTPLPMCGWDPLLRDQFSFRGWIVRNNQDWLVINLIPLWGGIQKLVVFRDLPSICHSQSYFFIF